MKNKILKLVGPLSVLLYNLIYLRNSGKNYNILTDSETIDLITREKISVSRFGDGEFNWMFGKKSAAFQENDPLLSTRLQEILKNSNDKNLLIGIPVMINGINEYESQTKYFWATYLLKNRNKLSKYLREEKVYCNTNFTRPYMDFADKSISVDKFTNIKRIWKDKNVLIVEGDKTRFGVGNDLLSETTSISRIVCPSRNAFSVYEKILAKIESLGNRDQLILLSLGPTATVLAVDLCKQGYQAIDIGHLDVEYEWFIRKSRTKVSLTGKFVNESIEGDLSGSMLENEAYRSSILTEITL